MQIIKKIWKVVLLIVKNKYILTSVLFFLWLIFFDNNNFIDRIDNLKKLNQLHKDKEYYIEKISNDSKRTEELRTNKENLEKFAREQYLMKKDDEDIFIFVEED